MASDINSPSTGIFYTSIANQYFDIISLIDHIHNPFMVSSGRPWLGLYGTDDNIIEYLFLTAFFHGAGLCNRLNLGSTAQEWLSAGTSVINDEILKA